MNAPFAYGWADRRRLGNCTAQSVASLPWRRPMSSLPVIQERSGNFAGVFRKPSSELINRAGFKNALCRPLNIFPREAVFVRTWGGEVQRALANSKPNVCARLCTGSDFRSLPLNRKRTVAPNKGHCNHVWPDYATAFRLNRRQTPGFSPPASRVQPCSTEKAKHLLRDSEGVES
jgi:hypothetical protein